LNQINGRNCHGSEKLVRTKQWLSNKRLSRKQCHIKVYSDDLSDSPLLDFADEALLVTARASLVKIAHARGWKDVDFARNPARKSTSMAQWITTISLYLPALILAG
jgi:phosphoserine phosphatase